MPRVTSRSPTSNSWHIWRRPGTKPVADDVATLGLDILLAEEGWKRGAQNPFLLGY
jgi:FdhE protein